MEKVWSDKVKLQSALSALLRAGLWGETPSDFLDFHLSETDWTKLFACSKMQSVTGIVFSGMQRLDDKALPSLELKVKWMSAVAAIERKNRNMNKVLGNLTSFFHNYGLNPILLKGQGFALMYDKPHWRECGDIDFYFSNVEEFDTAVACLKENGINVYRHADGSISYLYEGVIVEHHQRWLDTYSSGSYSAIKKIEDEYGFNSICLDGTDILAPSPFLELLIAEFHILKHVLGWGIGLKQFCDIARICHSRSNDIDKSRKKIVSDELGLKKWNCLLYSFLNKYLGLRKEDFPYKMDELESEILMEMVWKSGNMGFYKREHDEMNNEIIRKMKTACSFGRNIRFAVNYAPKELIGLFATILKGQLQQ